MKTIIIINRVDDCPLNREAFRKQLIIESSSLLIVICIERWIQRDNMMRFYIIRIISGSRYQMAISRTQQNVNSVTSCTL